jgi:hypothetical protein
MFAELMQRLGAISADDDDEPIQIDEFVGATVLPAKVECRRVLFVTKARSLLQLCLAEAPVPEDVCVVGRYGVLSPTYASVLTRSGSLRSSEDRLLFVGDLDPLDIAVFMSVREQFPQLNCVFHGVTDTLISLSMKHLVNGPATSWKSLPTIAMSSCERAQLDEIAASVNLETLVGPMASSLLINGRKLEIEGAANPALFGDSWPGLLADYLFET